MSATKKQARACYDNYFGTLRCLNGGTREENERSANGCREAIRPYVLEAAELVKNPSKLLRQDAWLMRALAEDIPANFAAFNRNYPPAAAAVETAPRAPLRPEICWCGAPAQWQGDPHGLRVFACRPCATQQGAAR